MVPLHYGQRESGLPIMSVRWCYGCSGRTRLAGVFAIFGRGFGEVNRPVKGVDRGVSPVNGFKQRSEKLIFYIVFPKFWLLDA